MWSITEVARASGVTSRTLRHDDAIGLLPPALVADNGWRYYGTAELLRLQQILLLRNLGLGLDAVRQVLAQDDRRTQVEVLEHHLAWRGDEAVDVSKERLAGLSASQAEMARTVPRAAKKFGPANFFAASGLPAQELAQHVA